MLLTTWTALFCLVKIAWLTADAAFGIMKSAWLSRTSTAQQQIPVF